MNIYNQILVLILIFSISTSALGQNSYEYTQPPNLQDGWKTNTLQSLKVDSTLVYKLFEQLQSNKHQIHGIILVKNNQIIIEEYFDNYLANTQHDLRSTTKSITSILMGIAIDKGYIASVNDPISKYLKDLKPQKNIDKRKKEITINHLLIMSSGLDCNDWDKSSKGQEDKVYKKKDWLQYFLDLPLIHEPGTVSNYCTMGQVLATEIISQTSGIPIDQFAQKHLFDKLGITNINWRHTSKKEVIPSAKRLWMTPRDMAKIGQMMLNKGQWNGQQVVSKDWIELSTSPKTKITGLDYGFLWWNIPFKINEKLGHAIVATGNGGQYIFIFPKHDMVAVFTGGAYNSQDDKLPFNIVNDIFLPTFCAGK